MSSNDAEGSITQWIAELQIGANESAQQELWNRYFDRLMGLARRKLGAAPRASADEEDVALCALNSFFNGMADGEFPELSDRTNLWPLLAKITANKALNQQKHLLRQKRGGGRVRNASDFDGVDDEDELELEDLLADELTPAFLAMISEECQRLMTLLPNQELQEISKLKLDGFTNAEIAEKLQVVERTIERRLNLIRSYWDHDDAGPESEDR